MRVKSGFWVAAYLRRCAGGGVFAAVRRRGDEEAGAIFIKIDRRDGSGFLYGPATQSEFGEARPADRIFTAAIGHGQPSTDIEIEARLVKEVRFDPDLWIVEVEDRSGRSFLDNVVKDSI